MKSFIAEVVDYVLQKEQPLSTYTFILPSKRAGVFLRKELLKNIKTKAVIAPEILSIESFIEKLSNVNRISSVEVLFLFYNSYKKISPPEVTETFESFSKWAPTLLQDFNEIDSNLVPPEDIFNYLSAIQEIKHWSKEYKTDLIHNYLVFWKKLPTYYTSFTNSLLQQNIGYIGLLYRKAVENLEAYIQSKPKNKHLFVGFNALNKAEETIIQELLENKVAEIFWDTDEAFFNNSYHNAGAFVRTYKLKWNYYKNHSFNWVSTSYKKPKNINVYGLPKNISQVKYIGTILEKLSTTPNALENTAVILADENLLIPTLNALPNSVKALNITMGFPLKAIPLSSLFSAIFELHKKPTTTFYYQDVLGVLSHPFLQPLFKTETTKNSISSVIDTIISTNMVYISLEKLEDLAQHHKPILNLIFKTENQKVSSILENIKELILRLKAAYTTSTSVLTLEYLFRFNELFNEIKWLNKKYNYIHSVTTLQTIYNDLLQKATLDFKGEPLQGLQIMGMLESRVLNFETIIIASVNEGILPAGKTINSFIPFDVKLEYNLPTYKEKDAVYAFHFYHLLQRAKNVHILYNTETDVLLGGEKSRFLLQLENENIHTITHKIISPKIPNNPIKKIEIAKNQAVLNSLKEVALKGFSPSSLTHYIRNPINFYNEKILGVYQPDELEENIAFNTLGTVIHNTLEDLYTPLVNTNLTIENLSQLKPKITKTVTFHFKKEYKEGDIETGKNKIIFEIAKRYILNFIQLELEELKKGNKIKIIALEASKKVELPFSEFDFPIYLTGKIDRIDTYNGAIRIIDYKTGKVEPNQVEITSWEELTTNYEKCSKSFQLLCYTYMLLLDATITLPVEAGIYSFKNLKKGILKFAVKQNQQKEDIITNETITHFSTQLKALLLEIFDSATPFIEKQV